MFKPWNIEKYSWNGLTRVQRKKRIDWKVKKGMTRKYDGNLLREFPDPRLSKNQNERRAESEGDVIVERNGVFLLVHDRIDE